MPAAKLPHKGIDINELIGEGVRLLKEGDLLDQDMKTKMVKAYKSMDRHIPVPYTQISAPKETKKSQNRWIIVTALIATYGFLKNISPESPYLAEFFVGPKFNFTVTQVTQDIYPVSVYGSVVQTSVVLLVTDILRYKPIIVCGALGFVLHKSLLVFGVTLLDMQLNQFFFATTKACSLAYKTYIYNKVDREHYQIVTAVIRIAPKAGTLFSAVLAQVALSFFYCKIEDLNKISLVASVMALICAILLPSMKQGVYAKESKSNPESGITEKEKTYSYAVWLLLQDFKEAYTNPYVVKWCIWWILATGGFQQVTDYYIQVLWSEINHGSQNKYNGGVEAVNTIVSGISCYLIGSIQIDWRFRGELVLGICTLFKGMFLLFNATTSSIIVSYCIYVAFCMLFDIMSVVANAEVAKHLKNESFALIFGTNTFLGLVWQSLLTYILTNKHMFALPIREQFVCVSCGFMALGLGYTLKGIYKYFFSNKEVHIQKVNEITPICTTIKVSQKNQTIH
ncbi:folate transporter 1-like [Macrosteles quadrilineatus]|uniref:folate transporter 1-like n=1 Tax=Macrosteles quadrilineatus TaxID=74068 RepID=UPI0023E1F5C1|nr:folate transporter 1-like [Macrosteles quadrilineatus]